ncbi:glucocorticoid-induced transcript 1 protein-like isoform X2 [Chrysoperla carnea]|uniref:glucocorticoid-induced transcript 1 protein-like isoform X2 n=1 Tax=Chrysoperla carnea TaxID=189513 RepID=UPI001D06AAC6|nr:glucocorticoid-induced transcript 1 protein-like isoform X2 [Chrysoperla carnea]
MSGQRIHHKSSPSSLKQGPMKATIPMISLFKQQTTNLRKSKSNSPTLSPTNAWKTRSPDHSSGQRSPGSTCYKVKSKTLNGGCSGGNNSAVIRRTASLDTIYLKGQWPRDCFYMYTSYLQVDKATQTDDWIGTEVRKPHRYVDACGGADDKLKMIRHKLQRNAQSVGQRERLTLPTPGAIPGDHTVIYTLPTTSSQTTNTPSTILSPTIKASPVNIPVKPLARPMRSSIEGLNQEIEGLVLKATGTPGALFTDRCEDEKFQQNTPEGHRAPLADLLRSTRSVNTQTPAASELLGSCQSSGGSQGSSPDQEYGKLGTSPHINRFLAREPPDGCEKVNLKFMEDSARRPVIDLCPLKPNVTFQLKPSQGSAFYPLQQLPSPTGPPDDANPLPLVPPAARPPADRP